MSGIHQHPDLITVTPAPPPSEENRLENEISAALLGGAIADAMGWVTEFIKSPGQLRQRHEIDKITDFISWEKMSGGRFNPYIDYVGTGEYSDDTQLTLCVARSIQPDGKVNNEYFAKVELVSWLDYARGAGATITAAAKALKRRKAAWNQNFFKFRRGGRVFDYRDSGANGIAMRVAPIAMASPNDSARITREVWKNGIVTHGHPKAVVGALVQARAVAKVIMNASATDLISELETFAENISLPEDNPELLTWRAVWDKESDVGFDHALNAAKAEMSEAIRLVKGGKQDDLYSIYRRLGCFSAQTKGSAIGTVAAALATYLRYKDDFEQAVLTAVNMIGSDTDTIAGMVGTLVGGRLGYAAIPERWAERMQDFSYFLRVASALARISQREAEGSEFRRTSFRTPDRQIPLLSSLTDSARLARYMRVQHPIFGVGSVTDINVQYLRSKRGGSIFFITVLFDSGQSCKFKFFRGEAKGREIKQTKLI